MAVGTFNPEVTCLRCAGKLVEDLFGERVCPACIDVHIRLMEIMQTERCPICGGPLDVYEDTDEELGYITDYYCDACEDLVASYTGDLARGDWRLIHLMVSHY